MPVRSPGMWWCDDTAGGGRGRPARSEEPRHDGGLTSTCGCASIGSRSVAVGCGGCFNWWSLAGRCSPTGRRVAGAANPARIWPKRSGGSWSREARVAAVCCQSPSNSYASSESWRERSATLWGEKKRTANPLAVRLIVGI